MPGSFSSPDATRPCSHSPLSLSVPVCELINLSPFGKLDRSRVLSLLEPVLLLGQDLPCLGGIEVCVLVGYQQQQQQGELSRTQISLRTLHFWAKGLWS